MADQTGRPELDSAKQKRLQDRQVARVAFIVTSVVVVSGVGVALVWRLRAIVLLIVVSLFLGSLLHPIVSFVERRGIRRGMATVLVFFISVAFSASVIYLFVHPVYTSASSFAKELPSLVRQAQHGRGQIGHLIKRLHLVSYVKKNVPKLQTLIAGLGRPALAVGKTVVSGIVALATVGVLTFFILLEMPKMVRGVLEGMRPERSIRARKMLEDVGSAVAGYMLGNFATSVIAGLVVFATLRVMQVPYAGVLAIWVGVVDFLPLVGGLLAGVPTVAVALLHSLLAGVVTLAVFLVYQQIENHILNPIVMSRTVRLNPLWVLLAILIGVELGDIVGSTFGGLVGALLAVPTASAIQVIAKDLWAEHHAVESEDAPASSQATGVAP
ncbi:MAG: AI-2E family transporter [Acidimicrobiales bacterium]|jgi:predicted PurR-regulated permease PerM